MAACPEPGSAEGFFLFKEGCEQSEDSTQSFGFVR